MGGMGVRMGGFELVDETEGVGDGETSGGENIGGRVEISLSLLESESFEVFESDSGNC
jgi:hypothetical protein